MEHLLSIAKALITAEPVVAISLAVLAAGAFIGVKKMIYGYKEKKLNHKIFKDMAQLYADSLQDQQMLGEEIRQARYELRKLASKVKEGTRFLHDMTSTLQMWKDDYPPSLEDIASKLKEIRRKHDK